MNRIKLLIFAVATVLASTSHTFIEKERSLASCSNKFAGDSCSWSYQCSSGCCSNFVDSMGSAVTPSQSFSRCAKSSTSVKCESTSVCPTNEISDAAIAGFELIIALSVGSFFFIFCFVICACGCCAICCPCCFCCGGGDAR